MDTNVISVSELTRAISVLFEEKIGFVSVQGEISNFKAHTSGHRYFTLKDDNAQIACTMWRHRQLTFQPSDGMKVIVKGYLTVYPPRGNYQIDCESITPLGLGDLYLAYEALKKKLDTKGYFEFEYKKEIPDLPLKIVVSTSPTGAAVKDIFSTTKRRLPVCEIYFRPTLVQGEGSAEDIVKAIHELQHAGVDVIIIGRGGGSIEDLWAYNTEIVADAIFNAKVPIISAVGHETDFTIADFVADLRAATPTAAAELVTTHTIENLFDFLEQNKNQLSKTINKQVSSIRDLIENKMKSYSMKRFSERLTTLTKYVDDIDDDMMNAVQTKMDLFKQKIGSLEAHCSSLNPYSPLNKGFALLESEGKLISNFESLGNFIQIDIIRKNEKASAFIDRIHKKEKSGK